MSAPVLKWQRGGCTSWCQTGWYASPAVADLDGDGRMEVVWGSYDLVALNGVDGSLRWRVPSASRVWPGVAVADLTGDGTIEIVVGRNSDTLTVYDHSGGVLWSASPFGGGEIRTLAVQDLETDGRREIVVGRASGGATKQLSVYDAAGSVRPGWPARRDGEPGYGWGMYNENVAVGDLDGDGLKEVIGPTDTHYITALDRFGSQLSANPMYGAAKVWSQVGVHVDHAVDLRGYANCGLEHRPNFANGAPAIADLDGDGQREVVVLGDVYDCAIGDNAAGDLYWMPWILRKDRTRWSGAGFDWTILPSPGPDSGPLSEDYGVIENSVSNAVLADLDGDGLKEILFAAYDGKVHAYWLDRTEKGNWPYRVPGTGIRFAGEPVVADLDNDGRAEVIFTSWPQKAGALVGQLHILSHLGVPLHVVDLPPSHPSGSWNGGLGAPTIANIDGDPDMEIVAGTASSGVVAWDLPGSASARLLWATGRGSQLRAGTPGTPVSVPICGDWDGNATATVGVFRPEERVFYLRDSNTSGVNSVPAFAYGAREDIPVVGDWDGDGTKTVGVYRPSERVWYLHNSNTSGANDVPAILYGAPGDIPVVGDWNGDGIDTVGVFRPSERVWYLRNSNSSGFNDIPAILYGARADAPVVGDWDGDGIDTIGVYRPSERVWYLRNTNASGFNDVPAILYGATGDVAVAGDWNGDGDDTIGVYRPSERVWYLRDSNTSGANTIPAIAY